ncbi:MAG TPA: gluconate 2-dehydrogenase subunit 3 family protein [Bacteroidota bacterium]|nr:gluconate 2-dehydrogenase subunit 3 family protein [Bacteroidota bacterium]
MDTGGKLSRRDFMKLATLGAGSLALIGGCAPGRPSGSAVLSGDDAALLGAIADRIIPPDTWPGGRENGVVTFIDTQLAGPYRRFRPEYRKGLDAITGSCRSAYGRRFEELSAGEQDAFLREMESGRLRDGEWKGGFSRRFFEMLRSHAMQAYYGSPRHGGNPTYASYRMMGLDYPPILGQNRYRL